MAVIFSSSQSKGKRRVHSICALVTYYLLRLAVAWLTMLAGLLADLFPSMSGKLYLSISSPFVNHGSLGFRTLKRTLFIVAMPIETMVSSIYWTLLLCWPHLILQAMPGESAAFVLPLRIDFALHAVPAIALLLDFMLFEHRYSRRALVLVAPLMSLVATLGYSSWVEFCASKNGTCA